MIEVMEQKIVITWKGQMLETLSREELIEAVNWLRREAETLREDRDRWRQSGSAIKYMLKK
jgi:hypothetical protein